MSMPKKSVYIDMDGTLARFHDADKTFIEAMWTPGFYVGLKPFENFVEAVKMFIERNSAYADVYVLSAVLETDPPFVENEKDAWLDMYLPEIDMEHRIYTRAGCDKANDIESRIDLSYLIDDYNKNLHEFEAAGGHSIKFHNDVNHRGLGEFGGAKGDLWQGNILHYNDSPEKICADLEEFVFGRGLDTIDAEIEPPEKDNYESIDDMLEAARLRCENPLVVEPSKPREIEPEIEM